MSPLHEGTMVPTNGRIAVPTRSLAVKIGCSNATAARCILTLLERGFLECVEASGFNRKNRKKPQSTA